jgi:S1-C subfamily serine protease
VQRSDIITAIADQPVSSADQLQETSLTKPPGTEVAVEFRRGDQTDTANDVAVNDWSTMRCSRDDGFAATY